MFLLWCVEFMPDSHGDSFASRTSCIKSPTTTQEMKVFMPCLDPGHR